MQQEKIESVKQEIKTARTHFDKTCYIKKLASICIEFTDIELIKSPSYYPENAILEIIVKQFKELDTTELIKYFDIVKVTVNDKGKAAILIRYKQDLYNAAIGV